MESIDSVLCEMLRQNADCCIVQDSNGSDIGYLNKKDIAEVVQPLEVAENYCSLVALKVNSGWRSIVS